MAATIERPALEPTQDLFSAVLERRFPSEHALGETPPALPNPELGEQVPAGEECPECGEPRCWWIFNPLMRHTLNGWTKHRSPMCACTERQRSLQARHQQRQAKAAAGPDQRWLDMEFCQRPTYPQTFLAFRQSPAMKPLLEAALAVAQAAEEPGGLYLAGPPSIGKGHLASAIVNSARAQGLPALSVTATLLLDRSLTTERAEEEQEACTLRRKALRAVPVLAIRDLFRQPLLPTEVKELDLLLDYREGRGLVTHFTSPYSFAQIHTLAGQTDARAALTRRVERLTAREVIASPRIPAFTERMARAAEGLR